MADAIAMTSLSLGRWAVKTYGQTESFQTRSTQFRNQVQPNVKKKDNVEDHLEDHPLLQT